MHEWHTYLRLSSTQIFYHVIAWNKRKTNKKTLKIIKKNIKCRLNSDWSLFLFLILFSSNDGIMLSSVKRNWIFRNYYGLLDYISRAYYYFVVFVCLFCIWKQNGCCRLLSLFCLLVWLCDINLYGSTVVHFWCIG